MVSTLAHRGPDDEGLWSDAQSGISLGFKRLAIIDLSKAGHQPMISACGRFAIVFNGEVYNCRELKDQLEEEGKAPAWKGHSDTEILLAAIAGWGVRAALTQLVGMFSFALWDLRLRTLTLARDRLGEKPLYYGWQGSTFLFGSELKALRAHPRFSREIDRGALCLLLRHNYIPAPWSIYSDIRKLEPGTYLTLRSEVHEPEIAAYWSLDAVVHQGMSSRFSDSADAIAEVERVLKQAVVGQMLADVPLGALLSGGIDSTMIVALMQAASRRPVRTFTIGFHEAKHNEADFARAVAGHLGTDHTELYVDPRRALDVVPLLPQIYDEPFADSSQIPTFLVSHLAREHVTVSLTGDGGDELFAGYNRYVLHNRFWKKIAWIPPSLRKFMGVSLELLSPEQWDMVYAPVGHLAPAAMRFTLMGDKVHKLAERLKNVTDSDDLYVSIVSEWSDPESVVILGSEPATVVTGGEVKFRSGSVEENMMYLDLRTYLPDDILAKVDRAAMRVSLETRVPFLDHRVVETAWRVPLDMKLRDGQTKWVLRKILSKYIPDALIERPKQGFGIPLGEWLRGPLFEWADSLLDKGRLNNEGYFRAEPIRKKWQEHLSGRRNWHFQLWSVLMFQAWLEGQ